jgi:hypothetical protein
MPVRGLLAILASCVLILVAGPVLAEWHFLPAGEGDNNVYRAFAFGDESDDRLEFACNSKRRDLFYSSAKTVPEAELKKLQGGEPTIVIRLDGVGAVPLDTDHAYQEQGRLIFVTAVTPAFISELGKAQQPVAAGMRANGKIFRQDQFPVEGLLAALQGLAAGCGF